jgi:hypothetical protein
MKTIQLTIQVSNELWIEMANLIADKIKDKILKQATRPDEGAEELKRDSLPSYSPRHFARGPRQAERQQNIRINDKIEVAYPEDGIMQAWDLPSKNDREAIRAVRDKALAFAERHGASGGQLKAIMKALTENGYYLIGPRRQRPKSA